MIGKKVFIPKYKEGETVELIYFYKITESGNERLSLNTCLRLMSTKKISVSEIGVVKQWVVIKEVISYGSDKYGYIGTANIHFNKLNVIIAHNQYPNYEYTITNLGIWKVFALSLNRGCRPTEFLYETLEIVKETVLARKNVPKSFLKKIFN